MHLMSEIGLMGVTHTAKRHSKTKNKYMKNYNKNEDDKLIKYLETNSVYRWSIIQPLPTDGWIQNTLIITKIITLLNVILNTRRSYTTYILIIHEHPRESEKLGIKDEWLSPYSQEFRRKVNKRLNKQK
ncbi:LOW QUALITY PROTEIN: hypothetical protein MAR_007258 [Mya arenaria]|uniref:Uncharacterized protein n=1 Tax=Mya arenaria TaxID=6604 RepID=A0ABY7DDF0_MYAAR|nr:LOW QUALITY PROTEIN: hypothetical protein MAR_007258 [Mya arenaria]